MNKMKCWTLRYATINALYFAAFCGIHMYAAVYLLSKGFTNTQIGIMLALANVLSVMIQPVIAGYIDKPGRLSNRNVSIFLTGCLMVLSIVLYLVRDQKWVIFLIYAFIYMIQMAYQPLIIAMNFEYASLGCKINFGLSRGMGSAGFALFSALIGNVLEAYGLQTLHLVNAIVLLFLLLFLVTFTAPEKTKEVVKNENVTLHNNFFDFASHYPKFMIFLLGTVCLFFAHNMINDFLIQIIRPLGGAEKELGYAVSLAAILELPTMAFFVNLTKKISCQKILVISGIFFTIKTAILFFAMNMGWVYVSSACQMAAYALFIPGSAYFVNLVMEELDQVKGQAYVNCAITLGGVFSNIVCGKVLDVFGSKVMLAIGSCVCGIGAFIVYISILSGCKKMKN
ncbi:MAG: MFS transporter [Lachnospiraceae bacterium]